MVLGFAIAVTSVAARSRFQAAPGQQPAGPLAPEKFKNIQVLKDVPAAQIEETMTFMAASLGYQCQNCHFQDPATHTIDYAADTRPGGQPLGGKTTAREMIKMMKTINDENFSGRLTVTCASCHNGHNQPNPRPALAAPFTPEQVAAMDRAAQARAAAASSTPPAGAPAQGRGQQPALPTVDDVLAKYIAALGGQANVDKLQSVVLTGTIADRAGRSVPFTIEEKASGRYRETRETSPAPAINAFDGAAGWMQLVGKPVSIEDFLVQKATRIADLGRAASMKTAYQNLRAQRVGQLDGKPMVGLAGSPYATVTEVLYFDASTGLLMRRSIATRTPLGQLPEQVDYADYRDVGGVKMPFTITWTGYDFVDTFKVTDAKPNASLPDSRFAKPSGSGRE
jgi:hypothetical protein